MAGPPPRCALGVPPLAKVRVHSSFQIIPEDPTDDKFLACAVDGRADCIVTGDRHLLRLETFRGIRILSPEEFLKTLHA